MAFLNLFKDWVFLIEPGRSFHNLGAAAWKKTGKIKVSSKFEWSSAKSLWNLPLFWKSQTLFEVGSGGLPFSADPLVLLPNISLPWCNSSTGVKKKKKKKNPREVWVGSRNELRDPSLPRLHFAATMAPFTISLRFPYRRPGMYFSWRFNTRRWRFCS